MWSDSLFLSPVLLRDEVPAFARPPPFIHGEGRRALHGARAPRSTLVFEPARQCVKVYCTLYCTRYYEGVRANKLLLIY